MKRSEPRKNLIFLIVMLIFVVAAVLLFLEGNDMNIITSNFARWEETNTGSVIPVVPWVILACAVVVFVFLHIKKK